METILPADGFPGMDSGSGELSEFGFELCMEWNAAGRKRNGCQRCYFTN